eukprot:764267-Hanusia_phi.AAC.1
MLTCLSAGRNSSTIVPTRQLITLDSPAPCGPTTILACLNSRSCSLTPPFPSWTRISQPSSPSRSAFTSSSWFEMLLAAFLRCTTTTRHLLLPSLPSACPPRAARSRLVCIRRSAGAEGVPHGVGSGIYSVFAPTRPSTSLLEGTPSSARAL